jgi:subtilisin family serine protease
MSVGNRIGRSGLRRAAASGLAVALISGLALAGPAVAAPGPSAPAAATTHASAPAASPASPAAAASAADASAGPSDGLLVRFDGKASASAIDKTVAAAGGTVEDVAGATGFVRVSTGARPAGEVQAALAASPVVENVEPNRIRRADMVPNDPNYSSQAAYLEAMHLPEAWDRTVGSDNLTLAIIDSGVDFTNPDLAPRLRSDGYDFVNNDSNPTDDFGHGTMVAGIAAAQTNNGKGVAGATWQGRILPIKVLDSRGQASDEDIAAGITYAVDHGASVINLSLGGPGASTTLQTAVDYATSHNVVVVAAAGNDGGTADATVPHYPAACNGVISVGATDSSGNLASFSSYGPWVDVVAPGESILTTTYTAARYGRGSGTSFSSPLVAGVALLLRSADPSANQATITSRIIRSADGSVPPACGGSSTAGMVDALAALGMSNTFTTASASRSGYWVLASNGGVCPFGSVPYLGDAPLPAGTNAVNLTGSPTNNGYWIVDSSGHVFSFGDAKYFGGLNGGLQPGEQVTSISATPTGAGYWLFTNAGRVFAFGDAPFLGDMSGTHLNGPVLGSVPTPSGHGYYMVASDGGIFAFGDAHFVGSMGSHPLNAPVQSLVPNTQGPGYWLVASDGGVFAFDAPFRGSMGGQSLNAPVTGMVPFGDGYLMVARDGGIFDFSNLAFSGSLGSAALPNPIVAVAA